MQYVVCSMQYVVCKIFFVKQAKIGLNVEKKLLRQTLIKMQYILYYQVLFLLQVRYKLSTIRQLEGEMKVFLFNSSVLQRSIPYCQFVLLFLLLVSPVLLTTLYHFYLLYILYLQSKIFVNLNLRIVLKLWKKERSERVHTIS